MPATSPTLGNLYPGPESPIGLGELACSLQSCRSVVSDHALGPLVFLCLRQNYQAFVLDTRVLLPVRIVLQFLISSAVSSHLKSPFGRVRSRPIRTIEVVTPDESPLLFPHRLGICLSAANATENSEKNRNQYRYMTETAGHTNAPSE
jgi:hypothetical protein